MLSQHKKKIPVILIFLFLLLSLFSSKYNDENFNSIRINNKEKYSNKIPIFTFHRLVPDKVKKKLYMNDEWVGSINIFKKMVKYIYYNGYKTLSTEDFYKWYIGEVEYNKKTLLITIDDGFYEDYYLVYPIIKKYNLRATSFVVGSRIKFKTAPYNRYTPSYIGLDLINKVRKEYPKFEFQSHSFNMHFLVRNSQQKLNHGISSMFYEEIENDILKNIQFGFTTMAYPYGAFTAEIKELLEKHGYLIAFRFGPANYATRNSDRFAIPRIKLNGYSTLDDLKKWLKYV